MLAAALLGGVAMVAQAPAWAESPPPALPASMQVTLDRYRYFTDCLPEANG